MSSKKGKPHNALMIICCLGGMYCIVSFVFWPKHTVQAHNSTDRYVIVAFIKESVVYFLAIRKPTYE